MNVIVGVFILYTAVVEGYHTANNVSAASVSFGNYPGYSGGEEVLGNVYLTQTEAGINFTGWANYLEYSSTGGWHVHEGYDCTDSDRVGEHYFTGTVDPWQPSTWTSDSTGYADLSFFIDSVRMDEVLGRAIVIHDSSGQRVGCGTINADLTGLSGSLDVTIGTYPGYEAGSAKIEQFPGYTGLYNVTAGWIYATAYLDEFGHYGVEFEYELSGLQPNSQSAFQVRTGNTCANSGDVGTNYWAAPYTSDPWPAKTISVDANGQADGSFYLYNYSLGGDILPLVDRTVVVQTNGEDVGCGTINYNPKVQGYLMVFESGENQIQLAGTFNGLELTQEDASGGFHIHTGKTCDDASEVGGHYFKGDTDPWTSVTYTVQGYQSLRGRTYVEVIVDGISIDNVGGRALVIHSSNGVRAGCGLLSGESDDDLNSTSSSFSRFSGLQLVIISLCTLFLARFL